MNTAKHVAFRAWYRANENYLVTQPFTEFVAAAAWKAGHMQALEDAARIAETPVSGEQDDITMAAKDRAAKAIRALKECT